MIAAKEDCSKMASDAKLLKDVTTKLLNLRLDHTEFTCLKALALFKPGMYDDLFACFPRVIRFWKGLDVRKL